MNGKLDGKAALVTGASRGIGAAIAKRLAQDGAAVAITYAASAGKAEEVVRAIQAAGGKAVAFKADGANEAAVQAAVAGTVKAFGRLDILVNNAGIAEGGSVDEMPLEAFDRMIAINVRGVWAATQAAVKHLGPGGRIVNIGSCLGERVPFGGITAYSATKGFVAVLTKGLARELGPRGITVNNVQPGPVDTDMNPADGPDAESQKKLLALPRYGQPEEIASAVAYLVSPEAAFITGTELTVDGGFAA